MHQYHLLHTHTLSLKSNSWGHPTQICWTQMGFMETRTVTPCIACHASYILRSVPHVCRMRRLVTSTFWSLWPLHGWVERDKLSWCLLSSAQKEIVLVTLLHIQLLYVYTLQVYDEGVTPLTAQVPTTALCPGHHLIASAHLQCHWHLTSSQWASVSG